MTPKFIAKNFVSLLVLGLSLFPTITSSQPKPKQAAAPKKNSGQSKTSVRFMNRAPNGYSHIVEVRGGRTLYIAGQIALDAEGKVVGEGNFQAQAKQVFANLEARLKEAGATFKDVVKLNYFVTDASEIQALRAIRDSYVNKENPPASTLVVVRGLFRPEFMIEVEAIAVIND